MKEISDDAATMVRAVKAGKSSESEALATRLATIRTAGLLEAANEIEIARVATLTGVTQDGADSLHRLVMDLHKALNRLAADCSEEIVAAPTCSACTPKTAHRSKVSCRGSTRPAP